MSYNHTATKWRAAGTRGQLSNWERRFRGAGDLDSTCSAAGVLMAPTPHGAQPGAGGHPGEAQQGTGEQAPLRESSSPTWARMPSTIKWRRQQCLGPFLRWLPLGLSTDGSSSEMRSFHSQSRSSLGLQCFTHKNQTHLSQNFQQQCLMPPAMVVCSHLIRTLKNKTLHLQSVASWNSDAAAANTAVIL